MTIPNRLHLIWLGTPIPNSIERPYRRRLIEWRERNPSYDIFLWTNLEGDDAVRLRHWAEQNQIYLLGVDSVQWGTEEEIVKEQLRQQHWVSASDMLRFRLLYLWGGIYVDLDVHPVALPIHLSAPLGIALNLQKKEEQLHSISMFSLLSVPGHELLQICLWEAEQNFQIIKKMPDLDQRTDPDPTVQYGATLALTGDLIRPALAQVAGLFTETGYSWSLGLEWMSFQIALQHEEDNSWLEGEVDHHNPYYPTELLQLIRARQQLSRQRMLTSILHWAAAFSPLEIVVRIAKVIQPFESYFGASPKGMALRYRREQEIVQSIPDM